jgi:predicted RNase H-like HicB family nuclease
MATSKDSKKSNRQSSTDHHRPFASVVLRRAEELAARYQVVVWHDEEENCFYGRGVELPLAMGDGTTSEQCIQNTREAFVAVLATLIEMGHAVPAPAPRPGHGGDRLS